MAPRVRLAWIDALRVCDAALVVLVHTDYLARPDPFTWWPAGIYSVPAYGLCVPLFFALAGFVGARTGAGELLRRALRLLPLLFAHGIVLLLIGVRDEPTIASQLVALVTGVWYLYFLSALVQLLAVHAVIERFLGGRQRAMRAMLFVAIACTVATYAGSSARLWLRGSDMGQLDLRLRSAGTTWAAFYAIGVALGRHERALAALVRRGWALALVAIVLAAGFVGEIVAQDVRYGHASTLQTLAGGLPFQIVGTVAVMAAFARAEASPRAKRVFDVIARAGPATLSIYLLHGTFLWLIYRQWLRSGAVVHPLEVPVLAVLAMICAVITRALASPLPRPLPWVLAGVLPRRGE